MVIHVRFIKKKKKNVRREVQVVPQSQAAANSWHQAEEKNDKNKRR